MMFDDSDANSIDNLLNDLDEVVKANLSLLTSSSSSSSSFKTHENSSDVSNSSYSVGNKTRMFMPHPPSVPKAPTSNSPTQPESTLAVPCNPKTRFAVDHRQYVDLSGSTATTHASRRTAEPISPPTVSTVHGSGKGRDGSEDLDENSVDRLLNLLSSPMSQVKADNKLPRQGYADNGIPYSTTSITKINNNNINNHNSIVYTNNQSSSLPKTSYYQPSRDSDLPIVEPSSSWSARERVSSWDEGARARSSSDMRDKDNTYSHSGLQSIDINNNGAGLSTGGTIMFQRNINSNDQSPLSSYGGSSQLSDQSMQMGSTRSFLPDKIGSTHVYNNNNSSSYSNSYSNSNSNGYSSSNSGSGSNSTAKSRCVKVVIAGASLERGRKASSFTKLACNSLRCMKCNFRVHCFLNSSWDNTIDYMFLRNTVPNETKLAKKLVVAGDSCAYCCQCTSVSETGERELNSSNPAGPQWVCSGH